MTCSFNMNLRVLLVELRSWRHSKKINLNFRNTTYVGQNANRRLPWGRKRPPKKSYQGRWASKSLPWANLTLSCWFLLVVHLICFSCLAVPFHSLFTACQILKCWFFFTALNCHTVCRFWIWSQLMFDFYRPFMPYFGYKNVQNAIITPICT